MNGPRHLDDLPGHRLRMASDHRPYVRHKPSLDSPGMAICECGRHSLSLPNALERTRWHRGHLADITAGRLTPLLPGPS